MYKYFILIIMACGLYACEKTEKVDNFPKHESKLVTNCIFSDDFEFTLSKSLSPLDNAPFKVLTNSNAYIKIFEDNVLFDSLYYRPAPFSAFAGHFKKPITNKTYRFECHYPGFPVVSGEDYLPDTVSIQKTKGFYTVISSYYSDDTMINGEYSTNLNIEFGKSSPYLMVNISVSAIGRRYYGGYYGGGAYGNGNMDITDLNTSNESEFIQNNLFVSNPSGVKTLNLKWSTSYGFLYKLGPTARYYISVSSCSKNTFEYLKREGLQFENQDDPFSQPTPISNNIINGYGIFGGMISRQYLDSF